jgi:hypothetical protein
MAGSITDQLCETKAELLRLIAQLETNAATMTDNEFDVAVAKIKLMTKQLQTEANVHNIHIALQH